MFDLAELAEEGPNPAVRSEASMYTSVHDTVLCPIAKNPIKHDLR
jgi:hypothetical protein